MRHAATQNARRSTAYVARSDDDEVCVIDTATNIVKARIPVGFCPEGVVMTPDGARLYVANGGDHTVCVIDTAHNIVVATVTVGIYPGDMAMAPDGTRLYVTSYDDTLCVIDTSRNVVIATLRRLQPHPMSRCRRTARAST